jgi:hypothetical protein
MSKKKYKYECEHGQRPSRCVDCGGSEICEHSHIRGTCKKCKGASLCEHNIQRSICKECKGASICEHNNRRSRCKECKGSEICEHNIQRRTCRQCKGSEICEHNNRRYFCKECGGKGICEHNVVRSTCRKCKGGSICEHVRKRSVCSICKPAGAFRRYMRSTQGTGRVFELTLDEFKTLVAQPCVYCNDSTDPRGIDRWDNKIGYTFQNSRPCCGFCNKLKGTLGGAAFVERCQRIAHHTETAELSELCNAIEAGVNA